MIYFIKPISIHQKIWWKIRSMAEYCISIKWM